MLPHASRNGFTLDTGPSAGRKPEGSRGTLQAARDHPDLSRSPGTSSFRAIPKLNMRVRFSSTALTSNPYRFSPVGGSMLCMGVEGGAGQDDADVIWIGPVGPIPVFHDDDFRLAEDRERGRVTAAAADAMHTAEELLHGMRHDDPDVRWRVVARLIARWGSDERTLPTLLTALATDASAAVRDTVAMSLLAFPEDPRVQDALNSALQDLDEDVRWSAEYCLTQLRWAEPRGGTAG